MAYKRIILVLILASSFIEAFCQKESKDYIYKGLVRTTLTFATGFMPKQKFNNLYLTGNIEYYSDSKISFRGDDMYFFNSMNQDKTLKQNHSLYGGAAYHFPNKNFDPFVGLQTGLAISQLGSLYQDSPKTEIAYNPLISRIVVFNFYAQKWFHLFVNARYNFGKHLASDAIMPLNELSFSFGLGFNIN
jgi:hypothetical protein